MKRVNQSPPVAAPVRRPFIGARYERNSVCRDPFTHEVTGPAPRVTILDNDTTYFGLPGLLVLMPWNFPDKPRPSWSTDQVKFNLEDFLRNWHPIENVMPLFPITTTPTTRTAP